MEEMRTCLTTLTGAVNRLLEQVKLIESRLGRVEQNNDITNLNNRLEQLEGSGRNDAINSETTVRTLQTPRTEEELKEISRLPDNVKELRSFDGNPTQYISWVHSVETILKDFEIVRDKPIYRAIVQSVRQKVVGAVDTALVSYNVFDNDWTEIKRILSLHYADKRDVQTLEHQLNQLSQGSSTVDEFYSQVNHQLSLIINKLKTESYSEETVKALVGTYRNRSLDIFIRGLKPDLSRMIIIQRPKTLPEAYSACLEMQNLTMRNNILHSKAALRVNDMMSTDAGYRPQPPRPPKQVPFRSGWQTQNFRSRDWKPHYTTNGSDSRLNRHAGGDQPPLPPRYPTTKREPMEIDRTVQTRQINYMNRPNPAIKRSTSEMFNRNKQPRLFHINADDDNMEEEGPNSHDSPEGEQNFMQASDQAYLT